MPTLTPNDVALLAEIANGGGEIFNPGTDSGCIRIGASIYTMARRPDVFLAFKHLQDRQYISSNLGFVFNLTEAGQRRLQAVG